MLAFIRNCGWFSELDNSSVEQLASSARIKNYESKHHLYRLGDKNEYIYGIVKGFVRVKINSVQGQEFTITEFAESHWFGELALTGDTVEMFEAQTLTECEILEIPIRVVKSVAERYPVIYKNLFLEQAKRRGKK